MFCIVSSNFNITGKLTAKQNKNINIKDKSEYTYLSLIINIFKTLFKKFFDNNAFFKHEFFLINRLQNKASNIIIATKINM